MEKGTLYIVATPIGNLADITFRAIEILKSVDIILCEDSRVSGKLLAYFEIKKPLKSFHQHSDDKVFDEIISLLESGKNIALITDSGTPGISDPGGKLNNKLYIKNNKDDSKIKIIPIPGASASASAVSVSGLVEKEFYFAGFLPKKKGRQTKFMELSRLEVPIVIYESAFRVEKTLRDIEKFFGGETEVFLAREMTKKFEEYWGGEVGEIISDLKNHTIKGEFVIVVKK